MAKTPYYTDRARQPTRHALYAKTTAGLRTRDARVRRLVGKMRAACAWLGDADVPTCRAWAEFEVLADQVWEVLRQVGPVNFQKTKDGDLRCRMLVNDLRLLRQAQLSYSRDLGLTPAARLMIVSKGSAPLDLAAAMAARPVEDAEVVKHASARQRQGSRLMTADQILFNLDLVERTARDAIARNPRHALSIHVKGDTVLGLIEIARRYQRLTAPQALPGHGRAMQPASGGGASSHRGSR